MSKRKPQEPRVGIMWLIRDKLIFDSTPLSGVEACSGYRDHPGRHIDVWELLQRQGKAPHESEYEEYPRGRVIYDAAAGAFTLYADKCILDRKDLIAQIKEELHLPRDTKTGTDPHYRCFRCLYGSDEDDDDSDSE